MELSTEQRRYLRIFTSRLETVAPEAGWLSARDVTGNQGSVQVFARALAGLARAGALDRAQAHDRALYRLTDAGASAAATEESYSVGGLQRAIRAMVDRP